MRVSGRFLENDPDSNMGAKLRASTPEIAVIARESTSKSAKTQVAAFTLLSSLAAVFPGILSEIDDEQSRSELMIAIERCIGDKATVTRLASRRSRLSRACASRRIWA